ncbi:MAG: glucosamine-6-phosphate deaminase [Bacilli bacterium]
MKIYKLKTEEDASKKASEIIIKTIKNKEDCVLGLATGSTPLKTYQFLIDAYKNKKIDFSKVAAVNLDEYKGLSKDDPNSYSYFMDKHLFNQINIKNTNIPDGMEKDPVKACNTYQKTLNNLGPVDLQILGIGLNGHIGFNEPGTDFNEETHLVSLSKSTISANRRFFLKEEDVPKFAYTMGIKTIMKSKTILLIATGKNKKEILKESLTGPVTTNVPASILQTHENVIVIGDSESLEWYED